jgi:hypothetical protein
MGGEQIRGDLVWSTRLQRPRRRLPNAMASGRNEGTLRKTGCPVDDHPVMKPRYRAAPRVCKCCGHDPMQETRHGPDKQSGREGHCLPLMLEIRLAHGVRVVEEEPIEHLC